MTKVPTLQLHLSHAHAILLGGCICHPMERDGIIPGDLIFSRRYHVQKRVEVIAVTLKYMENLVVILGLF